VHVAFDFCAVRPEYVFAGQSVHASGPVVGLNLPTLHPEHPTALEPVNPVVHRHMVELLLPTGETAFAVHGMHVAFEVAAVAVEY
jgi:hypothetical protein